MTLGKILEAFQYANADFVDVGKQVGKLYTDFGFPIDMSLERIDVPQECKVLIIHGACMWLIEHKRNSGGTEKSIERQRKTNLKITGLNNNTASHEWVCVEFNKSKWQGKALCIAHKKGSYREYTSL